MAPETNLAIEQTRLLSQQLAKGGIKIQRTFLFGSQLTGEATKDSDIDVALVSDQFSGIRFKDVLMLIPLLAGLPSRLEIHPYNTTDFSNPGNWFAEHIRKTGLEIK